MDKRSAYVILNGIRLVGPVRVAKMRQVLGSVEAILTTPASRLAQIDGIGQKVADTISDWQLCFDLEKELDDAKALGLEVIHYEDDRYPVKLREIYDPPLVLYIKGDPSCLEKMSIAVVGSRHTSYYGGEVAKKLSYQMAYSGISIVSGLARGIDTMAHQGALAAKGSTVAVMGCSLDRIYPSENEILADKISESGGLLISEFALGRAPDRQTFPMRNRIVSGLSSGVLVIEAGAESGALITAQRAMEQGRQVFAVPGRIDQGYAAGCHRLIKDGAKLVEGVEDVMDEFAFLVPKEIVGIKKRAMPSDLSKDEVTILESIGDEEMELDYITRKCGLPTAKVSSTLLRLEMKKLVQQLPGKVFVKTD
ncbi:MAG: DNA-processing protein DprA [Verrucomicrobiota bacterium]